MNQPICFENRRELAQIISVFFCHFVESARSVYVDVQAYPSSTATCLDVNYRYPSPLKRSASYSGPLSFMTRPVIDVMRRELSWSGFVFHSGAVSKARHVFSGLTNHIPTFFGLPLRAKTEDNYV